MATITASSVSAPSMALAAFPEVRHDHLRGSGCPRNLTNIAIAIHGDKRRMTRICNDEGSAETTSMVVFVLLFPGYFFYQCAVAFGWFPAVLGGYFGIISAGLLPLLVVAFARLVLIKPRAFGMVDALFAFIVILNCLVSGLSYIVTYWDYRNEVFLQSASGVLFVVTCYMLARTLAIDKSQVKKVLWVSFVAMVLTVGLSSEDGVFNLRSVSGDDALGTYQGISRSVVATALMVICLAEKRLETVLAFVLAVVVLFLAGARSEFVQYLAATLLLAVVVSWRRLATSMVMLGVFSVSVLAVAVLGEKVLELVPQTRILELLDLGSATSYLEREILLSNAIETIVKYPFLGSYGSYYHTVGKGGYAHNLLSAWVDFGLIGFVSYVVILLVMAGKVFVGLVADRLTSNESRLAFVFFVFSTIAFAFSKDYSYMFSGFAVGFVSRYEVLRRKALKRSGK
ncbi:O-antigen ligase family protein [Candidatus Accumulibacter sp. ACC007]|uniref:O-antigen ligase family protein n=1 Tax=Candidatus Accumulibacter sp. ACC007 TaxID=2823333 RepID=UPI0025BF64C0|nr:O-antigen ligase family protein [Candidatus Accumulibacter sp. ACC007]